MPLILSGAKHFPIDALSIIWRCFWEWHSYVVSPFQKVEGRVGGDVVGMEGAADGWERETEA